ncbi:hypothetical protein [Geobacter argillaceus]|uniref:Uncharacterized protein n=1 Tax=Geobacter argillaceus TaxID=345631 RepID=A0A562VMB8_9BACT|nr:hypothetical protein [Geobacter argillaceus]TWJ19113.1 hypothetical protein JN12_02059 [Geobacter argillaceus]
MPDQSTSGISEGSVSGNSPPLTHLTLTVPREQLGEFFIILQQGFTLAARVGSSLRELLCDQLGLSREYVTERITTLFLNGKAIDNLESTIVTDGSTVALSAAMPGLVGATMRRGGYYAAMRGAITYQTGDSNTTSGYGTVRIKLFNLLLSELGPDFLQRGIMLPAPLLNAFLRDRSTQFWETCSEILLNDTPIGTRPAQAGTGLPACGMVSLTVQFKEQP